MGDYIIHLTSYILHLPSYRMQLVVVSAVRNAVRAATNIFTVISINFVFFIVSFLHCLIFHFLKFGPFLKFCIASEVQGELLEQREPTSALDWQSRDKSQQS